MLIGIFGTGRNGSSLLTRLLDGILGVYTHSAEVNFLSVLNDLAFKPWVSRDVRMNATVRPLMHLDKPIKTTRLIKRYTRQISEIISDYAVQLKEQDRLILSGNPLLALNKKPNYTASEFIPEFFKLVSRWLDCKTVVKHYIFKTIETPYVEDYQRLFPDMKFLHLIRNPLDVYSSQKRTLLYKKCPSWYLGKDNLDTMIMKRWIPHAKAILNNKKCSNHYLVRYEDLVDRPKETIEGICNWLSLPLPAQPTKQTVFGGKSLKKSPQRSSQEGIELPMEVVSGLKDKFKYKKVLSDCEKDLIVYLSYDQAKRFGYFHDLPLPELASIVKEWIMPKRWEFMNNGNIFRLGFSFWKIFQRRIIFLISLCKKNLSGKTGAEYR